MKLTQLDYVVLVVSDLNRALAFYTDVLGLRQSHRAEAYAQLATGTTRLALYTREAMSATLGIPLAEANRAGPAFELGFKVESCDAAFQELLIRGVPAVVAPTTRAWGQRTAYVRDPDGNLIELAEDLSGGQED
jgi:lactoylglutathione lyase